MLKNNKVLEVDSKYFYYKKDKEHEENVIPLEQIRYVDIKRKNIYVLVKGEEILIKNFTLPNIRDKYILDQMIEREIIYYFNDITDMCYSYYIYERSKNTLKAMVFCLNCTGIGKIRDIAFKNNLKAVWIIQNIFLEYFHNNITHREFIFICSYESNLYLVAYKNKCIAATKTLKTILNAIELSCVLQDFIKECNEKNIYMNDMNVYVANIKTNQLEILHKNHTCIDLGGIEKEQFKAYVERRVKM